MTILRPLFVLPACVAVGVFGCTVTPEEDASPTGGTGAGAVAGIGGAMAGVGGALGGAGAGGATGGSAGASVGGAGGVGPAGSAGVAGSGGVGMSGGGAGGSAGIGAGAGGMAGAGAGAGGAGAGGVGAAGAGATAGSGGGTPVTCTFTVDKSTSSKIPTVGIVTWSSDLAGITEAHIDFGLDATYGMTAPVDLTEMNYRTLLLGMKASREYHFRVVASAGGSTCTGGDNTIMTGAEASNLPSIDITTAQAAKLAGGFLITGQYQGSTGNAPAYIIDADGDFVWWYSALPSVTGVRPSWDGKHMWINAANVPNSAANVHRVSMDGLTDENLSSQFTSQNHSLTVLPDETVAFYAYGSNGCDDIKERAPNGMVKTIINAQEAHGEMGMCHVNHIEYSPEDQTYVFSDLDHDNYTKVTRDGDVVWVLGGGNSDFTGQGATWSRQHGSDVLALDRLLIFNNQAQNQPSIAIEILLDLGTMSATRTWTYTSMDTISNAVMGDVQRLPNGNTIVAYSTQGVLHEVDPQMGLVREISWPLGAAYGYIHWRPTLYGAPPR